MSRHSRPSRIIGVSWHEPSGQFRKYVGKQVGRKGELSPKVFYLGTDERGAIRQATSLLAQWDALRASGATAWPSNREDSQGGHSKEAPTVTSHLSLPENITIKDAANLYLDEILQRAQAKQVSWAHHQHSAHRLGRVIEVMGPNVPLRAVGAAELTKLVLHFAARPLAKRRPHQKRPLGQPIAIKTAKDFVAQAKALFTWVAEHDRLDWEKPKRFERVFKVKWSQMKTPEERQREQNEVVSGDVQTYSSEDLSKLFHAASPRERLYILLGLNCGFTSSEIGSLARFELFLDDPQPFVHRKRPKTGVEARWKLWPETVAAIRQNLAERNPQQLAFLSIAGNPLVEVNDRCRRDVIKQAWAPLLKKAGIANPLGFKFLRKTGADRIKKLGGLEVSEMYLSHAEANGMNRHYANRNWTQMHGCLELLREQLKPLWHLKGDPESESAPTSSSSAESERREAA